MYSTEALLNIRKTISSSFKRMSNALQLLLLLLVTVGISLIFYSNPSIASVNSSYLINHSLHYNGIGGGNIVGNCMAGKKALPIYCVDVESKQNSSADGDDESESPSISENKSSSKENPSQTTTGNANAKYISISFDAAWGADDTIQILDILDKYNVKTTFFMTGGWVEDFPDMVKEIHKRGHDLGNHSQTHKHMSKLSVAEQQDEINQVSQSVKELTGYDMFLFRPPYGDYNTTLIETVYGCNYYPIQWSVDSLDWKDYGVDNIIKTVTKHKNMKDGAIVLMHNGAKYTAAALENVIKTLQADGYTIVPLSELIIRDNFHMDANGMQIAD